MVQVQSSWFPLYDRDPQTFVPNMFFAKPQDYVKATERIYHAPGADELRQPARRHDEVTGGPAACRRSASMSAESAAGCWRGLG